MGVIDQVGEVAKKYDIPDYIWKPILMTESDGDPNSIASTSKEYSVGLFQINMLAHSQYKFDDLIDPVKNAEIAMRDFISPAYNYLKSQGITDPQKLAEGVYSGINPLTGKFFPSSYGGIRPNYTQAVQNRFLGFFDSILKGFGIGEKIQEGLKNVENNVKNMVLSTKQEVALAIIKPVLIIGLIIVLIVLVAMLFPKTTEKVIDTVVDKGKDAGKLLMMA